MLRLTDSAFFLGWVGFCALGPVLLLALPAGVAAERLPRSEKWIVVHSLSVAVAATLDYPMPRSASSRPRACGSRTCAQD